jgi:carbonic anhydrase/acetyltransferase-like protein (isoleucine patch superfamily)
VPGIFFSHLRPICFLLKDRLVTSILPEGRAVPVILSYRGKLPRIAPDAFVAPTATVIGDVEVGEESGLWFGVIVRGDVNHVRIGRRTNLQDATVVHVTSGTHPTVIGDGVTVGHGVKLHGCTIGDGSLIGIGAIVLDGAVIGEGTLVAAGSLVAPGTVVPPRSLVVGSPARVKRPLTAAECDQLRVLADRYVAYRRDYQQPVGAPHQPGGSFDDEVA